MERRKPFKVRFDMDGVLTDLGPTVSDVANIRMKNRGYGDFRITSSQFVHWNALYEGVQKHTNSASIAREINQIWFEPSVLLTASPFRFSTQFSRLFHYLGIDQSMATSRLPNASEVTNEWMKVYFPWMKVYLNSDLGLNGREFKLQQATAANVHQIYEDDSHVAELAREKYPHLLSRLRLVSRPWNESYIKTNVLKVRGSWVGIGLSVLREWIDYERSKI